MARHLCHTCDVLKEIYWIKASRFALAVRPTSRSHLAGQQASEESIQALNEDAMDSLRTLLRHINSCYGFTLENVA